MAKWITVWALLVGLLAPTHAFALWLGDTQCGDPYESMPTWPADVSVDSTDCSDVDLSGIDPSDPSFNACFELAGEPISAEPSVLAEEQARQLVAGIVEAGRDVADDDTDLLIPSPEEASVEDPARPGQELVPAPTIPKRDSNSCSTTPDSCETSPVLPMLNLEVSVQKIDSPRFEPEIPEFVVPAEPRGDPRGEGAGPAAGYRDRLDRPPQLV
jgi:hypothetical protein